MPTQRKIASHQNRLLICRHLYCYHSS